MSKIIVSWTSYAKFSYFDELDFIKSKWTSKEVNAFITLVNEFIENLSCNIIQGKKYSFISNFKTNNGILQNVS